MPSEPESPERSFAVSASTFLIRTFLATLGLVCRTRIVDGEPLLDELRREGGPVVVCFWHESAVLAARFVLRQIHRRGLPLTALASRSRDGELVARLAAGWGVPAVRGSSSRGGRTALRGLYRAVTRDGRSPLMIPDGPRGPRYEFKPGVTALAQMTGVPILPLGFAVSAGRRLGSWDRLVLPRPFATIRVAVGAPRTVPKALDREALARTNEELEQLLRSTWERAWETCPDGPRTA